MKQTNIKQTTFKSLTEEYIQDLENNYELVKSLFKAKDKITNISNLIVCTSNTYEEHIDNPQSFNSIKKAHDLIQEERKTYHGLMERYSIEPEVDGYCIDGDMEIDKVDLTAQLLYYVPLSQNVFNKLIDENTYQFSTNFKEFMKNHLYKSMLENTKQDKKAWINNPNCKMIELFKDKVITYDQLLKATYSSCTI